MKETEIYILVYYTTRSSTIDNGDIAQSLMISMLVTITSFSERSPMFEEPGELVRQRQFETGFHAHLSDPSDLGLAQTKTQGSRSH